MGAADDISVLFQELVDAVQEEVVVLQRIHGENLPANGEKPSPKDHASVLIGELRELASDVAGKDSAELVRMAQKWSSSFRNIGRKVEDKYPQSAYADSKNQIEKRIYETARKLDLLTREPE